MRPPPSVRRATEKLSLLFGSGAALPPSTAYDFEQRYIDQMAGFGAPAERIDFQHAPDPARVHINAWAARETADRIRDLLPPGSIDTDTRLTLVNAVYLLADWRQPFQRESTRPRPFHPPGAPPRDVATMHQLATFRYAEAEDVQVLEMPYRGEGRSALSMTLLLPRQRDGLPALESRLDATRWGTWQSALQSQRVSVALPKFKIDPPASIALKEELEALGVRLAFDRRRADFTGIAAPPRPEDRLFISNVFHKAFVKVDEKGTEAAAATATVMARAAGMAPAPPPKEFVADHPFLFLIRDQASGLILFMGRVVDPKS